MTVIRLLRLDGSPVLVNLDQVVFMDTTSEGYTVITFASAKETTVKQSLDDIEMLIDRLELMHSAALLPGAQRER